MEVLQHIFDAYMGGTPIGGACTIRLQDGVHALTAFHVSHDREKKNTPRALILRDRMGIQTLYNPRFYKVRGSRDISLSERLEMEEGLSVATVLSSSDRYITFGSMMSLCAPKEPEFQAIAEPSLPLAQAPLYLPLVSRAQNITFGFSGKPVLNQRNEVVAVISGGRRPLRAGEKTLGLAEILRYPRFR